MAKKDQDPKSETLPLGGFNDLVSSRQEKKFLMGIIYLLTIALVALAYVLFSFMPLKEHVPYFLTINEQGEQLYYEVTPSQNLTREMVVEIARDYLKNYVVDANTIDNHPYNLRKRLERIKAMSTPQVFEYVFKQQKAWGRLNEGNKRRVEILHDSYSSAQKNKIQVTFQVIDITPEGEEYRAKRRVEMAFGVKPYVA